MNNPTDMAAFDAAFAILAQEPLPADAEARLRDIERGLSESDRDYFGDVWESFHVVGGIPAGLDTD